MNRNRNTKCKVLILKIYQHLLLTSNCRNNTWFNITKLRWSWPGSCMQRSIKAPVLWFCAIEQLPKSSQCKSSWPTSNTPFYVQPWNFFLSILFAMWLPICSNKTPAMTAGIYRSKYCCLSHCKNNETSPKWQIVWNIKTDMLLDQRQWHNSGWMIRITNSQEWSKESLHCCRAVCLSINNNGLGLFPLKASSCSTNITLCRGLAFTRRAFSGAGEGWLVDRL